MQTSQQPIQDFQALTGLSPEDADNLKILGPIMARHQAAITDYFYKSLAEHPETAALIEGRVDHLKGTHAKWFARLFDGDYGSGYIEERWRIGLAHVRIGLSPHWVEGVMNLIRVLGVKAIAEEFQDPNDVARYTGSLLKVLDLDLAIVNLSYQEDRLDRITEFTGMKRTLIENIIKLPRK
ncbi:MAG: hypothetical protein EP343_03185 [Deltaproteobacteria bacterium]|nr:MAG: hypothetical protein EP343_03185 [Deltaproteobacteria bacterium]